MFPKKKRCADINIMLHKPKRRFIKITLYLLLSMVLIVSIAGTVTYFVYSRELPELLALQEYSPSTVTTVFSKDNRPITEFYVERRIVVPISSIPDNVIKAFLAAEDATFFKHRGINIKRILGAFIKNVRAGRIVQGGSTITQQVVKSILLTPERSFSRKIKEAILAFKLESQLSKEDILYLYLNHIYFGNGAYGIQAAAENYFDKGVEDLLVPEVALLAGLLKAPNRYSPYTQPERALQRQRYVIDQMLENGFITLEQANEASNAIIDLQPKKIRNKGVAPYFTEHVRKYIEDKYGYDLLYKGGLQIYTTLDIDAQKAANEAIRYGLVSHDKRQGYKGPIDRLATIDEIEEFSKKIEERLAENTLEEGKTYKGVVTGVNMQAGYYDIRVGTERGKIAFKEMEWARKAFDIDSSKKDIGERNLFEILRFGDVIEVKIESLEKDEAGYLSMTLEQEPVAQAALIAMNPSNGEIKAMVGGLDFAKSQFNRAIQSRRQPGSAFKPIIYTAALDRDFTPSSIIIDSPIIYEEEVEGEEGEKEIKDAEEPDILDLQTDETDIEADEEKVEIKVWKPRNFDKRFHGPTTFRDALARSRNLVTIKLLNEIGIGYTTNYARRLGVESPLNQDLSMALGSSGVSLLELTGAYSVFAAQGKRAKPIFITKILDREGNILEEHMPEIEEVISPDTAFLMTDLLQGVVQRGTGWRAKALKRPSAGKTGTTNEYIDAWYIGYIPDLITGVWVGNDDERSLGRLETGSRAALPIWLKFMQGATEDTPIKDFPVPDGIVFARIDPETGLLARPGEKEAVFEAFKAGTAPKEKPVKAAISFSGNFFELDN
ncbi:MAG: penicillin-binding protein 1A [Thermodesulfobacteriota bacterium]